MGLREAFMVKQQFGATALTLTAKPGESLLVKGVYVRDPNADYITLQTDKTTVGYFRVSNTMGIDLGFQWGAETYQEDNVVAVDVIGTRRFGGSGNILDWMIQNGVMRGYPVAEGETFRATVALKATTIISVVYEVHDAGDLTAEMANGSKAKEYAYVNYGRFAAAPATAVTTEYTAGQNPAEFPAFPFGADVPAQTKIEMIGVAASSWTTVAAAAANYITSEYLKFVRERKVLFDDDRVGVIHYGFTTIRQVNQSHVGTGFSLFHACSDKDRLPPFVFPEPIIFESGEDFDIYCTTAIGGAGVAANLAASEIAVISKVTRS